MFISRKRSHHNDRALLDESCLIDFNLLRDVNADPRDSGKSVERVELERVSIRDSEIDGSLNEFGLVLEEQAREFVGDREVTVKLSNVLIAARLPDCLDGIACDH